ncbi:M24 family metallopeptidase [Candidatus Pelagibacter sp.]|uniref:M24 family metallopeptidase n=1 Tax=Candidatus Pelagibacter sp. TaxID=2024849 RepID=UPI003F857A55
MIKDRINTLISKFNKYNIDGYIIPKNDEFFSEYSANDRLKAISNFSGSAGYSIILKKKNYLFVDGRYTIQAKKEAGKSFKIVDLHKIINCNLFQNLSIGFDPKIFTSKQIKNFFHKNNKVKSIESNLIDQIRKNKVKSSKPFFSLKNKIVGENYKTKIIKIRKYLNKNKSDYLFITAPENIAWLLNIRGHDNPNSPIPNCQLIINNKKSFYLISSKDKVSKLINEKKIKSDQVIEPKNFKKFISNLKGKKIVIDKNTCSIFFENVLKKKFKVLSIEDPIYSLKSLKNKTEIKNMLNAHIFDGVALTKFIYWIKNINKKTITEFEAQNKLENFRKKNKDYLYPSFNTIAGTAGNAAIVHYRATKKNSKKIKKKDIFLCDSGGQYKYGTTDVTRTICFSKPKKNIKNIFTRVLKGHIAVVKSNLNKYSSGNLIDIRARKFLKEINLDYQHGTGHGVGFFLNVHEGPQGISKFNKIKLREGMILSNEPGYYKKNKFGIRIENLIYVKKNKNKLYFKNLTLAPIDKDLINFDLLTNGEKNYLWEYNLDIYTKLNKYLNSSEKKWLATFIQ